LAYGRLNCFLRHPNTNHDGGVKIVKFIFLTMVLFLTVSSIGLCAVPEPNAGISDANYYGLNETTNRTDRGEIVGNEIYGSGGIGSGYKLFANHFRTATTTYSDFGIAIKPGSTNWSLLIGQQRTTSDRDDDVNELFYGATFKQAVSRKLTAYTTYKKGVHFTTEILGITFDVTNVIQLGVCLEKYTDSNGTTFNGVGESLQIKF